MKNGCKGCEKRYPGCHDRCETYIAWKEDLLKRKQKERDEKYVCYLMMAMARGKKNKRERQKKINGR